MNKYLYLLLILLLNLAYSTEPRILFYQNDSIFVVNEKFETIIALPYKSNAILSPDYKFIFYTQGNRDWSVKFCIYNIETGDTFESQKFEGKNYFINPQWSSSSDEIVYKTIALNEKGEQIDFLEGYNFNTNKLFQVNLVRIPNPHFSYFCSYIDSTQFIMCDDSRIYKVSLNGEILEKLDFVEVFSQLPNYSKPVKTVGDTLFYVNDLSQINRPIIRDVFLLKGNIYLLTATITGDFIIKNHGIGDRAIFYFDNNSNKLEQLTPDSIAIENITILNEKRILFNGYSSSDYSTDGGWGDYFYHKSESGEILKNEHYFKKHIYEIDLSTKELKLVKRNAILSRSTKK